jgi:hypothetical protein
MKEGKRNTEWNRKARGSGNKGDRGGGQGEAKMKGM